MMFSVYQAKEWQCRYVFPDKRCCGLPINHGGEHSIACGHGWHWGATCDDRRQRMVRAKLRVDSIEGNKLVMSTVYEPDAEKDTENARFTKATPWGRVEMGIDNPAALERFKVGNYYYADFSDAPQ